MKLNRSSKKRLSKIRHGILMKDDVQQSPLFPCLMAYTGSALNVAGGGAITTVAADELTNINRQLDQYCK